MISYSSKYRSKQDEILDSFDLHGPEMEVMLNDLKTVNKVLGGQQVTLDGISVLLEGFAKQDIITIVDTGCGDGEMLRNIARFGKEQNYQFNLIGIDGNEHIIKTAKAKSTAYPTISYQVKDIFSKEVIIPKYHIALCTLFLHHFKNEDIIAILTKLATEAKVGVVVNDLHRSRIAFWLFRLFSSIFIKSKIAKHDGLVSVARGFKHKDLKALATHIKGTSSIIQWKWAFRWQWILKIKSDERQQ
jgi:2-polyprenyl-3-methyl-5-hydroxy-6-metoxy-1,4-benzoquinol methylase